MIFYLIGIPQDPKGNEIPGHESVYGYTLDRALARKLLDTLREHQDQERRTYAPGTIGTINDKAFQAELNAQKAAEASKPPDAADDLLSKIKL